MGRGLSRKARPWSQSPGRATRYKAARKQCACISRSRADPRSVRAAVHERGWEGGRTRVGGALLNAGRALSGAHVLVCGLPGCPEPARSGSAPGGGRRERGEAAGSRGTGAGRGGRAAGYLLCTVRPRRALGAALRAVLAKFALNSRPAASSARCEPLPWAH